MAFTQKDNSGSLFKNDKREKDTHPNATGTCMIDGREYWVSAWTKTRDNGEKWQSLAFKPKEAKAAAQAKPAGRFEDMKDDIPW
jgi:type II secretory pathway component PulJ